MLVQRESKNSKKCRRFENVIAEYDLSNCSAMGYIVFAFKASVRMAVPIS